MATKAELIQHIVESYPEKELNPQVLDDNYTVEKLHDLQKELAKEKEEADAKAKVEASKKVIKRYRLKDPKTQYAEGSFMLAGDQEKELPDHPSQQLLKRIKAGFIVEVN